MRHWNYRYLTLALFLPGFAFSVYKTFQAEVVPIKEYQRARVELTNIIPPVGDKLEDQSSSYQTYRAFSRYDYTSVQSKEWISSFFTHQLESAGWLTDLSGKDGRFFARTDSGSTLATRLHAGLDTPWVSCLGTSPANSATAARAPDDAALESFFVYFTFPMETRDVESWNILKYDGSSHAFNH